MFELFISLEEQQVKSLDFVGMLIAHEISLSLSLSLTQHLLTFYVFPPRLKIHVLKSELLS